MYDENVSNKIWYSVNGKDAVSQKVIKCTKEGTIPIILVEDYSILMYLFSFLLSVNSVLFFTSSETSFLHCHLNGLSDFWLGICI